MAFGNAMGESLFGAQATTILTKATVILAVVFMVNTIMLDRLSSHGSKNRSGSIMDTVPEGAAMPPPMEAAPLAPVAEPEAAVPAPDSGPAPAFIPQDVPVLPATPAASESAPVVPAAAVPVPAAPVPQT
jgi:preprotein translocase subunit SecG